MLNDIKLLVIAIGLRGFLGDLALDYLGSQATWFFFDYRNSLFMYQPLSYEPSDNNFDVMMSSIVFHNEPVDRN